MIPRSVFLLAVLAALAACEPQSTYPISGEECSADDPVQSIDAAPCPGTTATGIGI